VIYPQGVWWKTWKVRAENASTEERPTALVHAGAVSDLGRI